jgi:serine/threonine protein kinase
VAIACPKCQTNNPDDSKYCKECATPLPESVEVSHTKTLETPTKELTTGSIFGGRYQIIEELGKGGMGRVYKVLDTEINSKIALKLIKPEVAADKKTIERFRNELKIARDISHKNVCRMYDLGREKDSYFITMEYVSGQDLKGLIRQTGQLTVGKALSIAKQICEGLSEAHSLGVMHRDLKPNNIMIDEGGNAKIMDFGIARTVKGQNITGFGVAIGTPKYMSPEQVEGKDVDLRADIYSLGIILYEMLTDRVPFEGDTALTVGVKQRIEIPKDPKEFNPRIPDDLSRLILKCLEKERENRYQSTDEVRSDLDKIEQGLPTTDRVVPKKKTLTTKEITVQFSLKKIFIPAFVVIAIAVTGLIIWSPWVQKAPAPISSDKPSLAVVYFENNTGDENMDKWSDGFAELIIHDLSQSRLLHVIGGDRLYTVLKKLNLEEAQRYSSEDLKKVAEQAGVQNILSGRLDKAGQTLRISTRLQNINTGELLGTRKIDCQSEEGFFTAVDELTPKIKTDLNLNSKDIASDFDEGVGKITTEYLEAYRYYSEGRTHHLRGESKLSISFMEKAISFDPEFAMAYRSLAASYASIGQTSRGDECIQKAFELSDKTSETERLLIQGDYYRFNHNYEKAIEAYKKLRELKPDSLAWSNLGYVFDALGEWDKAIEVFETSRKLGNTYFGVYGSLGWLYHAKGMYEKAREVYEDYINNIRDDYIIHLYMVSHYAHEGKYDLALQEAEKSLALNPTFFSKEPIYHLQGDFEAAEKGYLSWVEDERIFWKMRGWRSLETLYRTLGQYKKAKKEAQAGLEYAQDNNLNEWQRTFNDYLARYDLAEGNLDDVLERSEFLWESAAKDEISELEEIEASKTRAFWWKIQVHLKQSNIGKALELAEEVKKFVDSTPSKLDTRWYLDDLGLIEMEKKNYPKAIDLFAQVYEMQGGQRDWIEPHAYILNNLASAYYLNGDLEAARKEYENILALTTGRLKEGDLYVKSFYMLGKIHEQQGRTAKAIENYEKFLDLWKDADPGLPEVEDAKTKLVAMKNWGQSPIN